LPLNIVELPTPVPRDGHDKPVVIPEEGGKPKALVRTTTFIDCIDDKSNLADWGKRAVLVGVAKQPSLVDAAAGLDIKADRQKLNALAERAVDLSGANDKRERGTELHALTELVDAGQPLPADLPEPYVQAMMEYLLITAYLTPVHREKFVVCSPLGVGGTPDGVCDYDGPGPDGKPFKARIITDLKTGSVEYGGRKMPAQLAVYSRAKFYDHTVFPAPIRSEDEKGWQKWRKRVFTPEEAALCYTGMGEINQDWGLIIHMDFDAGTCKLYWADLQLGWELAQQALVIRGLRKGDGLHPWIAAPQESPNLGVDEVDTVGASV